MRASPLALALLLQLLLPAALAVDVHAHGAGTQTFRAEDMTPEDLAEARAASAAAAAAGHDGGTGLGSKDQRMPDAKTLAASRVAALGRLHVACSKDDLAGVTAALKMGADVNAPGPAKEGKLTALIIASQKHEKKAAASQVRLVIETLLAAGAKTGYQDVGGGHALM